MGVGIEGTTLFNTHEYSLLMSWIGDDEPHENIRNLRLCAMEEEKVNW